MPDEFLAFAVDGDRDGRRDIWKSIPDAMATTANVLKDRGWRSEARSWGYEIKLPEPGKRFRLHAGEPRQSLADRQWAERYRHRPCAARRRRGAGLSRTRPPPAISCCPQARAGPAFMATENFDVLRSYNTSDLYALFVGHLADRVGCDTEARECPSRRTGRKAARDDFEFSVENLCRLQVALKERGFLDGTPDGLFGAGTRVAIGRYQKAQKADAGLLSDAVLYQGADRQARSRRPSIHRARNACAMMCECRHAGNWFRHRLDSRYTPALAGCTGNCRRRNDEACNASMRIAPVGPRLAVRRWRPLFAVRRPRSRRRPPARRRRRRRPSPSGSRSYINPFPQTDRYHLHVIGDGLATGLASGLNEAFAR